MFLYQMRLPDLMELIFTPTNKQMNKKTTENNLSKKSFVETFLQSVKKKMYGSKSTK